MKSELALLIACSALYGLFAFVLWSVYPGEWSVGERYTLAFMWVAASVFYGILKSTEGGAK